MENAAQVDFSDPFLLGLCMSDRGLGLWGPNTPHTHFTREPGVLCMNACDFTNICLNESSPTLLPSNL